ncbi:MAG: hypothetical protein MH204_04475 [Fimbriimonadaceae bacterium]|nr:hypothetical protein [Fimbriimonadaceae bacterium]
MSDPVRLIGPQQAREILDARGRASVVTSLDLNLTRAEVPLTESGLDAGPTWDDLADIAREKRKVFALLPEGPTPVKVFSPETGWVRSLCPTDSAPTVLVSGTPMHRIARTDPWKDTQAKLAALGRFQGRVLDTAFGLGYTAIQAAERADSVLSLEIDPAAVEIARWNPWSAPAFAEDSRIEIQIGDALEIVPSLPAGSFGAVIHDPPTLTLGGGLYGLDFYRDLARCLARGGRLFHYVADPDSAQGARTFPGVIRRLQEAGFRDVRPAPEAFGVTARRS